jgi:hypothetical protein
MNAPLKLILVVGFFLLPSVSLYSQTQRPLLRPTTRTGTVSPQRDETIIRSQNILVNIQVLRSKDNQRISLPLFDRTTLTLVRERQESVSKRGFVWYGKVAGQPDSSVVISTVGEVVVGNIMTADGKTYQIRYTGNGVHSLRQIDQSKFPREAQPIKPQKSGGPKVAGDTCSTDPPTDIDVMVVYTAAARTGAGGNDAMEATVYLAVAETNQSYLNSQITQRLRLAHFEEVSYTESGNINTDLTRLQDGADGFMDNVPTLRNTFAADNVVLITENGGGACGLGYMMETLSNGFESTAYVVVKRTCATGYYSFGHELGHNMGADHDAPNANSTGPYVYNRGFVNTTPTSPATPWRTIMSYNGSPSSTRVQFWSNPNVNFPPSDPMGVNNASDNHQVLNNTALTVANFRCSSPAAGNVWMKDTWDDTGAEPDPLTASEDMWKSPYIWVRNTQDTNLINQHQHQNPVAGQTNWVYVKIHNGFNSTTSGNLELYWANASTGLSWPSNWNLLTSIPVSAFVAHSTRIVEAQWNNTPGPGHFCMVARWVSGSDPMATPETTDINANVRANNNIVWRNLNIVALDPDASEDVDFIVRNVTKERMVTSLAIRPPRNEQKGSFTRLGRVLVRFEGGLMKAWRKGGARGTGFKIEGRDIIVTDPGGAIFADIVLEPNAIGYVKLTFKRLPETPKQQFMIDAVQLAAGKSRYHNVIGGVSYEIHTDRRSEKY